MALSSAAAGARAKRARRPDRLPAKDMDGPMTLVEVSRYVRDLMRQHDLDRIAWTGMEEVANDHARKLDELDHEALQVTDNLSALMDNMMVGIRNNEAKLKEQLNQNLADTTVAMQLIDSNLRGIVAEARKESEDRRAEAAKITEEAKKEFDKHKADSIELIKELQNKFKHLDSIVSAARVPFLDPTTGFMNTQNVHHQQQANAQNTHYQQQAQFYDVSTPAKHGASAHKGDAAGQAGAAHSGAAAGPVGHADGQGGLGGARDGDQPLPQPGAGARTEDRLPRHGTAASTEPPMRFPPGYGYTDARRDHHGPGLAAPMDGVEDKFKLRYDSKTFETKVAQEPRNQYDGGKTGISWKSLTRGYFISRMPAIKKLLNWAEDAGKTPIQVGDVEKLSGYFHDDPLVMDHLLWGYFNANLIGAAREIFCNVPESRGLEVWRRISQKINDRSEVRRDELYELVRHPAGTKKYEEVAQVVETWDTNQRLYNEAGGGELPDDDKKRIFKKMLPDLIRDSLILQANSHSTWESLKNHVLEKARELAVSSGSKPLHLAEPEQPSEEADMLAEIQALTKPSTEEILAIVNRRANGRFGKPKAKAAAKPEQREQPVGRRPPTDKDGNVRCPNCGAVGHDQSQCPKPRKPLSERECFICGKTGHSASRCPSKPAGAKLVESENAEDEMALALTTEGDPPTVSSSVKTENSFEALAADSDDESQYEEDWDTNESEDEVHVDPDDAEDGEDTESDDWGVPGECCDRRCTARVQRCIKVVQAEFNEKFNTNLDLKTGLSPEAKKEYEGDVTETSTGRPSILVTVQAKRELGLGHPLSKEPKNVPNDIDVIEPPPELPTVMRWSRKAHPGDCGCGCKPMTATSRHQKKRKGALLCHPTPEVCGAIGVHTDELLSETSVNVPADAMGGNGMNVAGENVEECGNLGNVENFENFEIVKDPEYFEIFENREHTELEYEVIDDVVADNTPCFFEKIDDDADEASRSMSSITIQAGSPGQGEAESIVSWKSEDEVDHGDHPEAEHQWEILKCSLIPGYVHQDIKTKEQHWAAIADRSNKIREEKEKRTEERRRRGQCLFTDEDMHDCKDIEQEEESIEYENVYADPRPIDTSIAFLDVEDVEVNVNEIDENQEFLDEVIEIALDSGAGDHVAAPKEAPAYTIEDSPGSLAGQHFTGAGGHRMKNQGQVRLHLRAENGKKGRDIRTTFQMAQVTRPLMSVSKVCDSGLWVKIDKDMATIMDKNGKEVCRFMRRGGLYIAKMRIRNPHFKPKPDFPRPGKK